MNMRILFSLLLLAALSFSAHAQSTRGWTVSEPAITCDGSDGVGHGTVYSAPPTDIVALPAKIVAAQVWYIGSNLIAPVTSFNSSGSFVSTNYGTAGNVGLDFDKGGAYVAATGFPVHQLPPGFTVAQSEQETTSVYDSLTLLGIAAIGNQLGHVSETIYFNPPLIWNTGDVVFSGYSCAQGGNVQMGWEIWFQLPN
jgi:hypothetical protein